MGGILGGSKAPQPVKVDPAPTQVTTPATSSSMLDEAKKQRNKFNFARTQGNITAQKETFGA